MSDPTREELIEALRKAANRFGMYLAPLEAGFLLDAILPRVLEGVEPMRRAGSRLSNAAVNLSQRAALPEFERKSLHDGYKDWDAAAASVRQWAEKMRGAG